ncbi:MAG: hypothetical protein K0M48_06150 [Thiobacillus sp.]|nr:hypothetical protein [Thiobacillus sp.]
MKFILLALAGVLAADPAFALQWGRTAAEDAMCSAQIAGRDKSDKQNWGHMHHYCDGLRFYNRALSSTRDRNDFNFNIKESLDGFDYVLSHTSKDFGMRPEVIAGKARTLALAGHKGAAVSLYTGVVQQTPKYVPAYLYLADYYASSDRKKALSLVSDGLRHNPGTKSLQRRYQELGGKLPYPEPLVQAAPAVTTPPPAEAPVAAAEASAEVGSAEKMVTEPAAEKPKIGSPTNPYCRFCPD